MSMPDGAGMVAGIRQYYHNRSAKAGPNGAEIIAIVEWRENKKGTQTLKIR